MLFSVIYSADCPRSESISRFRPPQARRLWETTEGDEQFEYGDLKAIGNGASIVSGAAS